MSSKLKFIKDVKETNPYEEKRFYIENTELEGVDLTSYFRTQFPNIPEGYGVVRYLPAKIVCRKYGDCSHIEDIKAEAEEQ